MSSPVSYAREGRTATIVMDDGKVNCINLAMLDALNGALDRAESDGAVVVLKGRPGVFSAGFDLKAFQGEPAEVVRLLRGGGELLIRLLSFPTPVIIASTGHALAMGSFLTLAGDIRIGLEGAFRYGMNEVAIGMTLPYFTIVLSRHRLAATHFDRAANTAEIYGPAGAVAAGFLDQVVDPEQLDARIGETADRLAALNMDAHRGTKTRVREGWLRDLREAIDLEFPEPK